MNPELYQPMSTAAIACIMLGDKESAEKYRELYVAKGGDEKKIRNAMMVFKN